MLPLVSVIIPAHKEGRHLGNAIKSISGQSYDNIELIVINDGEDAETNRAYFDTLVTFDGRNSIRKVNYIQGFFGSAAKSRNRGARSAHGEIFIFHDADCIADKEMVKNVVKGIEFGFDGVAAKTTVVEPRNLIERAIKAERSIGFDMTQKEAVEIYKGAPVLVANMRAECFKKLNGFNEKIFYFEDQDLTNRFFDMEYTAYFDPEVIEYHNDPSTLKEQVDQSLSNGKGIRTLLKQGRIDKVLIPLYPIVFLVGIISLLLGNPILSAILWSPIIFIFLILISKEDDMFGVLAFIPLFMIRNVFKLVGLIKG